MKEERRREIEVQKNGQQRQDIKKNKLGVERASKRRIEIVLRK